MEREVMGRRDSGAENTALAIQEDCLEVASSRGLGGMEGASDCDFLSRVRSEQ